MKQLDLGRRLTFVITSFVLCATPPASSAIDLSCGSYASNSGLEVVQRDGWSDTGNEARCDLGILNPLATPKVSRDITLRNAGPDLVTITAIQPTCGCSTVFGDSAGSDTPGSVLTLPPGSETTIHSTLDLTILRGGPFDKIIYVSVRNSTSPVLTLHLTGAIKPTVTFSLKVADFGRVSSGQASTIRMTSIVAPDIYRFIKHPRLISTAADVEVRPVGGIDTITENKSTTCTYILTISARARIGPLSGRLMYVGEAEQPSTRSTAHTSALSPELTYLAGLYLPIAGEVSGHIAASPTTFVFGSVPVGQGATQQVRLIGRQAGILDELTVSSSSPYLSARVVRLPQSSKTTGPRSVSTSTSAIDASIQLEATVSPKAPVGGLKGEVVVTTRTHERLVLPVLLDVSANSPFR